MPGSCRTRIAATWPSSLIALASPNGGAATSKLVHLAINWTHTTGFQSEDLVEGDRRLIVLIGEPVL